MSMYAEVVVHSFINDADNMNLFDYIIPEEYDGRVTIGSRVVVPFGKNRLIEGCVINIKESTEINKSRLKAIDSVPDNLSIISENQIELAKWMSKNYMCSLIDSLKCIMPGDMVLKENRFVVLNMDEPEYDKKLMKLNDVERRVIDTVINSDGYISYSNLNKRIGKSAQRAIDNLVQLNIVAIKRTMNSNIKDKTIRSIKISVPDKEIEKLIDDLQGKKKHEKQINLLNILRDKGEAINEKELIDNYGISRSTINSLIKKDIVENIQIRVLRDPYGNTEFSENIKPVLTQEQKSVIDNIFSQHSKLNRKNFLIHGVTGSGKTEVYMQLIEEAIRQGKQAIMLVPEISLTPQTIERFKGRFKRVAVIHSRISQGERYDEWKRILEGEIDVVVGARSAVFAPFNKLGIIIIDEEHENSYKSDKTPKYHTREVAFKRCEIEDAILVLGSATPGIETYYEAKKGKYIICDMKNRVDNRHLPKIELVDMRQEIVSGNRSMFSKKLYDEIKNTLHNRNQVILFLNRRGYSTFVSCRKCGHVMKCPKCDVSLTYHLDSNILNCHYCDHTIKSPDICPSCGSKYIKYFGAGTQRVENEVRKYFPKSRVLRMDLDTTSKKGSHDLIYNTFKKREADILIGTQMVSKGLDFPGVSLVGIIAADLTLNLPDYRSCERTFQLVTQVSGRAGRGDTEGKVIVQTYNPEHYCIQAALNHDYQGFYDREILLRQTFNYPPYCDLVNIVVSSVNEQEAASIIKSLTCQISNLINGEENIYILGPSPAPISKINTYYRWQTIIKGKISELLRNTIKSIIGSININNNHTKISMDINPVNML